MGKNIRLSHRITATFLSALMLSSALVWQDSAELFASASAETLASEKSGVYQLDGSQSDSITGLSVTKGYSEAVSGSEAAGIILSTYNAEMNRGESVQLSATVVPADAEDKTVTWSSSDNSVAFVDSSGLVTGLSAGKAQITATLPGGQSASCVVAVYVPATAIWFEETEIKINNGETRALTPKFSPPDAYPKLIWTLEESNSGVQLDKEGNVTGLFGGGKGRIMAETAEPGKDPAYNTYFAAVRARCNVYVESHATDLVLSNDKLNVTVGEQFNITAEALPQGTTDTISWSITDNLFTEVSERQNYNISSKALKADKLGKSILIASTPGGLTRSCEVTVSRAEITETNFVLLDEEMWYDGQEKMPRVELTTYYGYPLMQDVDYTVTYKDNVEVGVGSVTVTGIGNYTGQRTRKFRIRDVSSLVMTLDEDFFIYDGTPKRPGVKVYNKGTLLTEGKDYVTSYSNNVQPGTATATVTGINNISGSKSANFTISREEKTDLSECGASLTPSSFIYDGGEKRPTVTIYNGKDRLVKDVDFLVTYQNNISVGTATAVVEGIGSYTGSRTLEYTIIAPEKKDISECTATLSQSSYVYDGSAKTPDVTIKSDALTLMKDADYTVAYSNNIDPGNATVTVTGTGDYKGTRTLTFVITEPENNKKEFIWGVDNWNFINNTIYGHFNDDTYRSMINQVYLDTLKENLTPTEYEYVFNGVGNSSAWLDKRFGGCCYGMTTTTLLAKLGYLPFSDYKPGVSKLNDLDYPAKNPLDYTSSKTNVSSLIVYYQMVQVKPCLQKYGMYAKRGHKDNITEIIELLDKNPTVSVGFRKEGWGGHSILAYDYEYGSFNKNGTDYQGRIKICDPNSSNRDDDNYYIYFNTNDYSWEIPAYSSNNVKSKSGAYFNFVNADLDVVNEGGYLSGSSKPGSISNFVARMDVYSGSNDRSVTKVQKTGDTYSMANNAPGDIEECYSYVAVGESEGVIGYNLYDVDSAYKVAQPEAEPLELSIIYDNCLMTGNSKSGKSIVFDKSGCVEIHGDKSDYSMSMTSNDSHPTDWFSVSVDGDQASFASLEKKSEGWVVSADELKNVKVNAHNRYSEVSTTFSTSYESALIYEIDQDTIGIAIDADNNGTYETTIMGSEQSGEPDTDRQITPDTDTETATDTEMKPDTDTESDTDTEMKPDTDTESDTDTETKPDTDTESDTDSGKEPDTDEPKPVGKLGDIDGDGTVDATDALSILRSSIGMANLTPVQRKLADVDNDSEITSNDALAVLRFSVGFGSGGNIGKIISA